MQFIRKKLEPVSLKTIIRKTPNQIIVLRPINYIRYTLKNKKPNQTKFFRNAQTLNILNLV